MLPPPIIEDFDVFKAGRLDLLMRFISNPLIRLDGAGSAWAALSLRRLFGAQNRVFDRFRLRQPGGKPDQTI